MSAPRLFLQTKRHQEKIERFAEIRSRHWKEPPSTWGKETPFPWTCHFTLDQAIAFEESVLESCAMAIHHEDPALTYITLWNWRDVAKQAVEQKGEEAEDGAKARAARGR